jgi:signal transduction histidine kinase
MYGVTKVQELQKTLAEEQQRQQQIQDAHIEKENRLEQYGFTTGLVVMLLIAFILYRNNMQKKKANVLLQHQKEKIESTLQELKATQAQLIQSEKMASLGEVTAGIAHEIQNPLNFVNNFSEVNNELIEELKSKKEKGKNEKGNVNGDDEVLLNDIFQNNEKISFHGKRADAIVKGMLQHSRVSTGKKEPTDINALADEYLRLSYHGMKAKDKNFDTTLQTDFDHSIEKLNVVPQDIGRVLLNLFNNAFYAMNEKTKLLANSYQSIAKVTTQRLNEKAVIRVEDNGTGIPQKVVDKIFQPFFTTKPTGQGTGLGLSLSYDIIKAHGGEIRVETKEGEGSTFIIQLPFKKEA